MTTVTTKARRFALLAIATVAAILPAATIAAAAARVWDFVKGDPTDIGKHGVFGYFLGPDFLADRMPTLSKWLGQQDASGTRIPGWTSGRRAIKQHDLGIVKVSRKTFDSLAGLGVLSEDAVVEKRS